MFSLGRLRTVPSWETSSGTPPIPVSGSEQVLQAPASLIIRFFLTWLLGRFSIRQQVLIFICESTMPMHLRLGHLPLCRTAQVWLAVGFGWVYLLRRVRLTRRSI